MDASHESRPAGQKSPGPGGFIDAFLKSPVSGIAPWILLSIVSGPGRFDEAVGAALAFTLLVLWIGRRRGVPIHLLEWFSVAYFAGLFVIGLVVSDDVIRWLELWAGELTNVALALFATVTLAIRRPFTMSYAKDTTPAEHWDTPLFKKINYVISAAWAAAFTFAAVAGFIGDAVFKDPNNFWTGWILQLAAIFFAMAITEFYPDYATTRAFPDENDQAPPIWSVVDWLPTFVLVTGIVGLITDSVDSTLGWVLIGVGAVGSVVLKKVLPDKTSG